MHRVATLSGHLTDIGHFTNQQLTRFPFADVFPDFPARRGYLTLDATLVEGTDLNQGTNCLPRVSVIWPT